MELMDCKNLDAVSGLALNFAQLLELGKVSSAYGSIHSQSKYMSCNRRWFKAKEGGGKGDAAVEGNNKTASPSGEAEQKFVTQNSLVELKCVHGPKNNS